MAFPFDKCLWCSFASHKDVLYGWSHVTRAMKIMERKFLWDFINNDIRGISS